MRSPARRRFSLATAVVLAAAAAPYAASCATSGAPAAEAAFDALVPRALPAPGKEPARVLLDEMLVRFEATATGPVALSTSHQQVQILGPAGQRYTEIGTGYSATFERVERFAARVVDADGHTVKSWGREEATDVPQFPDFVLYSDSRVVTTKIPDQPSGNVVETSFTNRMTSPHLFAFGQGFGADVPVLMARLVVDVPDGFTIEHVATLGSEKVESQPVVEKLAGFTRYTWQRAGMAAMVLEPDAPHWGSLREQVSFRLASWTDAQGVQHSAPADDAALSRYTYGLMKDRVQVTPELQAQVKEVLTGVADEPRAKARRLYAWTRDSIRYCAVSVGMGGWVPHTSVEVEEQRYGDCKDKANLLKTMLQIAGVNSRIVTIYADMWPEPYRLPVLAGNFNHAILLVDLPEGPVWVDPTTRTTPFDDLPPVDEDRFALPISEEGSVLTATLPSMPERERTTSELKLTLDPASGSAKGTFHSEVNGAFADALRGALLDAPAAEHGQILAQMLPLDDAKVGTFKLHNEVPPEEVTPCTADGDVETRFAGRSRGDMLLSSRALFRTVVPTARAERTAPLILGFRSTRVARATFTLPAGATISRVPDPVVIDTPQLHYALTWKNTDGVLSVEREIVFKVRAVKKDDMAAYAAAADKAAAAEEQKVVLHLAS